MSQDMPLEWHEDIPSPPFLVDANMDSSSESEDDESPEDVSLIEFEPSSDFGSVGSLTDTSSLELVNQGFIQDISTESPEILIITELDLKASFGWELLLYNIKAQLPEHVIKRKFDLLYAYLHYVMVRFTGSKCVGTERSQNGHQPGELLPNDWNKRSDYYNVLYWHNGVVYSMMAVVDDEPMKIGFSQNLTINTKRLNLWPLQLVQDVQGHLNTMIPSYQDITKQMFMQLIGPCMRYSPTHEVMTQTDQPVHSMPPPA